MASDTIRLALAAARGKACGRLGRAPRELGRDEDGKDAYRGTVEAARRHGHPCMAAEVEDVLDLW